MMAARLLSRSKTLTLSRRIILPSSVCDPISASNCSRSISTLASVADPAISDWLRPRKVSVYEEISLCNPCKPLYAGRQALPRCFFGAMRHPADNMCTQLYHSSAKDKYSDTVGQIEDAKGVDGPDSLLGKEGGGSKVVSFSPLEGSHIKGRASALAYENSKVKVWELSQKVTYALMPALFLVSKTPATTSLLVFCVFWQIYGFYKEIFLDYVHQEVTRKWVLIYFKLLLLIGAKDLLLLFGLV